MFRLCRSSCLSLASVCGKGLRLGFKLLVICYFIFCALFLVLRYGVLPNVERYKPDVEHTISQAIGRDVSISAIKASWQGFNPRLAFGNVVIRDQQGRNALVLPDVKVTLSWWSVLLADLRFDKIEIANPSLDIARDAKGKLYVAGFLIDTDKDNDGKGLEWVLAQHEILIRNGLVRWNDQLRSAPELALTKVNFVLNNQWRKHNFAVKAAPPAGLAAPVDIRGSFQHPAFTRKVSDISSWTGDLYADLRQADLSGLKAYITYPADLQKGQGTVRSWMRLEKGRIADFTADVSLVDVLGKFRKDLPSLDMAQVSGRLIASERLTLGRKYLPSLFGQAGHTISLVDLAMQTRDGIKLPATTIRESFIPGEKGQPEKIELYAKLLDLNTLANFAEHLPLPNDQRQMLLDFAPKGQLKEFTAQWQGVYPEISAYSLKGQFVDLSMLPQAAQLARLRVGNKPGKAAVPAIPGFENLSGFIDANDKGGSFTLDSKDLALQLPGYFVDPVMPFSILKMQASWKFQAQDSLLFQVKKMEFQQDGLTGSLSGQHILSMRKGQENQRGEVDISGSLSGFDVKKISRYIPEHAPDDLRHWLSTALLDGRADDVQFRIKGALAQFPFSSVDGKPAGKGEFLVKGKIVDGKLDFAPGHLADDGKSPLWPVIENIKGSFIFDRAKMEIKGDTANTLSSDLVKVKAVIPDLLSQNAVLNIDGNASGGLQGMLQYVAASPVAGWLGYFLHETKASSNAQLALKLQLPLKHLIDSKVQGVLQFANNDAVLQPSIPLISGINGKLDFNEKGVNLNTLKGSLLGGAVVGTGGTQKDGSIRIKLDGLATAEGLRDIFLGTPVEALSKKIIGSSRYLAQINVISHQPELIIDTPLQGIILDFPSPLHKQSNQNMPLHFEMRPVVSSNTTMLRDDIKLALGSVINARYQRQRSQERNATWQVLRGGIGVNLPAPEPESGLHANIDIDTLNVDAWSRLLGVKAGGTSTALTTSAAPLVDLSAYIEPSSLGVRTAELYVLDKKLDNVVLGATHQKGMWQANIDSRQASGYISWNEASSGQGLGNVSARLSKLIIPQSAANDVTDLLEGKNTSSQIPSLDIVAENFELFNKKLGNLELLAVNLPTAIGREWRINKLSLKNDDAELKATGKWLSDAGNGISNLNYVLDIANAGKLLDRLGFANVVRGGRGKLEGDVRWNGLPFAFDIPSISGQLKLELGAGQFLKEEPGAARLLGVLSMQSLARRLTLDFRDVFSEGFAFDGINGTAQIQQGLARTNNFKMRSLNATVLIDGSADLAKESQDLHVAIIPEINAGTASVVYALAVNPVIGLGTFLAQLFLREPLARAFTYEYQVTGSWKDPQVLKIESKEAKNKSAKQDSVQTK
ncbi:MAG: YhdP family protein [Pseudomonadota bacterium]